MLDNMSVCGVVELWACFVGSAQDGSVCPGLGWTSTILMDFGALKNLVLIGIVGGGCGCCASCCLPIIVYGGLCMPLFYILIKL